MMNNTQTARYTATLPIYALDELKALASSGQIPSVNFAIRQAVDEYLKQAKKKRYEELMKEAAEDKEFIKKTMSCCK